MILEHAEAIDTGAAERYALGEMSENERDQYEEHFFECPECAAGVKAATAFLENAQAVMKEDDVPDDEKDPRRTAAGRPPVDAPAHGTGGWRALFWPMPLGAAAAFVVLLGGPAAYLAFYELPRLERARARAESLQAAPWHFLSVSRSSPPVITASGSQRMVGLTLSRSDSRTYPYYLCEIRDGAGRVVMSNVVAAPPGGGELQILLPTGPLQPGSHEVAVAGLESAPSRTPASDFTRYPFVFARGGG